MVGKRSIQAFLRRAWLWLFVGCLLMAAAGTVWADPPPADAKPADAKPADAKPADAKPADAKAPAPKAKLATGHLIRISVPIRGNEDNRIRDAVSHLVGKLPANGTRPVLIFELYSGQVEGGAGSDFGRALALARYISSRELNGVKTVAYIPKTIKGHAVLVAMACEEIIMAPDADIGEAGIDEPTIGPTVRSGYKEIADARKTVPPAIALGMLDKDLTVLKVVTPDGTDYLLSDQLDEVKKKRTVQSVEELAPRPGLYSGQRARHDLGFVSYLAANRQAVARALDLSLDAVREDPSLAGTWRPVQVPLKGPITEAQVRQVQRMIEDQVNKEGGNFVCLRIDSAGGRPVDVLDMARFLASLDPAKVRTVAYIPERARGNAALIAAACDQIVMRPDAELGGSGDYEMNAEEIAMASRAFRQSVAPLKDRPWSLPLALIDANLKVYRFTHQASGVVDYFSDEEAREQKVADGAAWQQGEEVTSVIGPLRVNGEKAEELGLAWHVVENFDQFKQLYGLENDVTLAEPGWAAYLVDALASPGMISILIMVGFAGVIAELYTPGVGIGGFIALVAFMLYFWIQHLQGTAGWLEVLLFLAGVGCLLLEVFVLPGMAIFGLGGGLMIIASLVLASQTFILPHNDYQVEHMRNTLLAIGGAVVGAIAAGVLMRRYLPHTPVLNRMLLQPPSGEEMEHLASREALVDFRDLLGQTGTATTPLMPSGKARFRDRLVDVIADNDVIDRGTEVVVVDVRGYRVLVRAAAEKR